MKGRMKPKGFGIAAPVLLAALLIAAVIVPAMSAQGYGTDDRVDRLAHDLENAVASYNEAVTGGCSEDAANYTEEIDQILTELEALGMQVEFTVTSEDHGMATVAASVVPAAEQQQTRGHSISANEEQLEIIRQLWGQNITIGEYMEKVIPEVLEDMPEETVEYLYATRMTWQDPSEVDRHSTIMTRAFKSFFESTDVQPKFVVVVHHSSSIDITACPDVDFSSYSRVWLPNPWYRLPYMAVWSYLWCDDTLVAAEFNDGYSVYEVEASGSHHASPPCDCYVHGYHYGTYPPGYTPPTYAAHTYAYP